MRRMLVLSAIILTMIFVSVSIAQPMSTSKTNISTDNFNLISTNPITTNPISAVGHGVALDAEGNKIDVTPEFIRKAQRYYIRSLLHQANKKQRAKFWKKRKHLLELKGEECDQRCRVHVNSILIAWLIKRVKPENTSGLVSINNFLRANFATSNGDQSSEKNASNAASKRMLEILRQESQTTLSSAANSSGTAYIKECRAAGVPIPPDWGSADWKSKGILTTNFVGGGEAEVFTFESSSPRGICFALPRLSLTGDIIKLLGIICQGSDTSKACFWDNSNVGKNASVPLADFKSGAELTDVCSDCHAGENAFIVHPCTPLDLLWDKNTPAKPCSTVKTADQLKPNNWHVPLVIPSWPQNPGPTKLLDSIELGSEDKSCTACHNQGVAGRFPQVSRELPGYCGILQEAIRSTMPPADPGDPSYRKHTDALLAACKRGKGELASDNSIKVANSPAESFTPCFGEGDECPRKKTLTFTLTEAAEVFIRYDLGQSHGCCADHAVGVLQILFEGERVHSDRIAFFNYGVQPISEFLEDFGKPPTLPH